MINEDQHAWNEACEEACRCGELTRDQADALEYHDPAPVRDLTRYLESRRWAA